MNIFVRSRFTCVSYMFFHLHTQHVCQAVGFYMLNGCYMDPQVDVQKESLAIITTVKQHTVSCFS